MRLKHYILFAFLALSLSMFSQTYTMNDGVNATVSKCSGTFVDSGGSGGKYGNSQSSTITFCPANPGDKIKISFTSFDTEDDGLGGCLDYLDIWYASAVGASGSQDDEFCGVLNPFTITSISPDGCISLQFTSDSSTNYAGWVATISCVTPCSPPVAALVDTTTVNICPSQATNPSPSVVSFDGTPSTTPTGTITKYEWNWGDGTKTETPTPTTTHTFTTSGIFVVMLKVRNDNTGTDPLGCESTNAAMRTIRVLPPPSFTGTTTGPVNVTCGGSTTLNAAVGSQTMTQQTPSAVSGVLSLPDGSGDSFTSGIDYTGFFPAGTKITPGCYPILKFNLEHSWSSDLSIDLISPSGQTVRVFNNGFGHSNKFGTCVNGADNGVPGCGADYTVVNSGGINWPASGTTGTTTVTTHCPAYNGTCETGNYYKAGTYNSANPFSAFDGAEMNGVWTIKIIDHLSQDDGTLFNWSLVFPKSCYATLATVTPALNQTSSGIWSNAVVGTGPAVPVTQTPTNSTVTDPGPGACPTPGTCLGNKLTNSVSVGPFSTVGSYVYNLNATDSFGCQYINPVTVNVSCSCPTATISYSPNAFCSSDTNVSSVSLNGTLTYTGGTYSVTPSGLNINTNTGAITPNLSSPGVYIVAYDLAATPGCPAIHTTTSVTISTIPTISVTIPNSRCGSGIVPLGATASSGTINWYASGTGGTSIGTGTTFVTPTIFSDTTYYVDVTVGTCTTPTRTPIKATVNTVPILTINCGTSTATSVQFNWNSITDATSYNYSYTVNSGIPITGTLPNSTTTFTINNLLPNQTVAITVTPVGSLCGLPSNGDCVTSNCSTPIIDQVANIAVCPNGTIPIINFTSNPSGATINWVSNNTAIGSMAASGINTIPSFTAANVTSQQKATITATAFIGTCTGPSITFDIIVNPLPIAAISGTTSICSGTGTNIAFSGTPNATVTYTVNSGTNQNLILDSTGNFVLPTGNLSVDTTYNLISVSDLTTNCSQNFSGKTAVITIKPLATVTISGTQNICLGDSANITFNGTSNAFVTYTLNSGINQTLSLDSSGTYTLSTGSLSTNAVYDLVSVLNTANACSQPQSGRATVAVNPMPTVIATPNNPAVCSNQATGILLTSTITGTTFSWKVSQTGVMGATSGSGNIISQVLTATGTTVGSVDYSITPTANGCAGEILTITVLVSPLPIVTITPDSQTICSGNTTNIALSSDVLGTAFNWNAVETNISGASEGNGNVISQTLTTIGNNPGKAVYSIIASVNGCRIAPILATIFVNPIPVGIASPPQETICSGRSTNIVLTSNVAGTTYSWSAIPTDVIGSAPGVGNTITQTLNTSSINSGKVDYTIIPDFNNCSGNPIPVLVNVNPISEVFASTLNATICSGDLTDILLSPSISGTKFAWTFNSTGVIGAANGTGNAIVQSLESGSVAGTTIYTVTPTLNNCDGSPISVTVNVNPSPTPAIAEGVVCIDANGTTLQTYTLDTNLSSTDYTFKWYFNSALIDGATSSTYEATKEGNYSVIATNTVTGCISKEAFATIAASVPAISFDTEVSDYFTDDATVSIKVTGGTGPFLYQIDGGQFQSSYVFSGLSSGSHNIVVKDAQNCTNLTKTITVIDYPKFFSPNGDENNPTWGITGLNNQPDAKISIYDRYGKLIKQISTVGDGWDGTYNGKALPATDYWFTVEYSEGGVSKLFKSHFALMR